MKNLKVLLPNERFGIIEYSAARKAPAGAHAVLDTTCKTHGIHSTPSRAVFFRLLWLQMILLYRLEKAGPLQLSSLPGWTRDAPMVGAVAAPSTPRAGTATLPCACFYRHSDARIKSTREMGLSQVVLFKCQYFPCVPLLSMNGP